MLLKSFGSGISTFPVSPFFETQCNTGGLQK
jgi:hypothetical protein